jgi:hypothetical protein
MAMLQRKLLVHACAQRSSLALSSRLGSVGNVLAQCQCVGRRDRFVAMQDAPARVRLAEALRASAAVFGLQSIAVAGAGEPACMIAAAPPSPISPASDVVAEQEVVHVTSEAAVIAQGPTRTQSQDDTDSDWEEMGLLAAALVAEARRLPGPAPQQVAARSEEPLLPVAAGPCATRNFAEAPAWALTALRSRDVAASVFRSLDESTQQSLVALGSNVRDALLVAACVDPQYWREPGSALAAAAQVAERTLEQSKRRREEPVGPTPFGPDAPAGASRSVASARGEATVRETSGVWARELRSGSANLVAETQ